MPVDYRATSKLLMETHLNLAQIARDRGDCDHTLIHEAVATLTHLSQIANHKHGSMLATRESQERVLAMQSRGISLATNVGDPMPHGPSPSANTFKKKKK